MEASEKPQLTFDVPATEGTVRALDGRIVIEGLTVDDERAARLVRERQQAGRPAAETVRKAIEIGARVLDSEETAANVDYVRASSSRLGQLDRELGAVLGEHRAVRRAGCGDIRSRPGRLRAGSDKDAVAAVAIPRVAAANAQAGR